MVIESNGEFVNKLGQKIVTASWVPEGAPKAVLFWHHGLAEHCLRYQRMANQLAESGIAVHTYDAQGHGRSAGPRAQVSQFQDLVDDAIQYTEMLCSKYHTPGGKLIPPLFIGGQSLGGLITSWTVVRKPEPFKSGGLILCAAAIDVEYTLILRIQAPISGLLSVLMPHARLVPAVAPLMLNRDPKTVEEYVNDPLNQVGNTKVRMGAQTLYAFRGLRSNYQEIRLPILAFHGTADKVTSLPAVEAMLDKVGSTDKTLRKIEGAYHCLHHEPEGDEITAMMAHWMEERASRTSSL